ncbi:hypothetical protein IDM48_05690 [Rothia amarae]|uniref:Uncharacterized protein n=1 Tax=Rothia amarae TaxID=169480 RepID=A0A7H2BMH4_9MICC|nr:hypothetical protein [Rothia amarae]QNV40870.1 hypothetical protein IDM48_05690 [Rothia amarae]
MWYFLANEGLHSGLRHHLGRAQGTSGASVDREQVVRSTRESCNDVREEEIEETAENLTGRF